MLPNHQPLVVAEQFGVLEALYPGRIDLGVGRSVGFTDGIRAALGRGKDAAEDFPAQLGELLGYFSGDQDAHPGVHARPAEGLRPAPFVLATGEGAAHAAAAGVPLVVAAAIGEDRMMAVIDRYRELFRPSMWSSHPYVVVAGTVAVAETEEAAHDLLLPEAWASAYSRTRGTFPPLIPRRRFVGSRSPPASATSSTPRCATRSTAPRTRSRPSWPGCSRGPAPTSSWSPPARTTARAASTRTDAWPNSRASPHEPRSPPDPRPSPAYRLPK